MFWNRLDANKHASFKFVAWDINAYDVGCGFHNINASKAARKNYFSVYRSAARVSQLRIGCDHKEGTVAVVDACGKCGGDNSSCLGCDGVLNSGATLSK